MNNYIIYILIFPNGKVYIGQTIQEFNSRLNSHKSNAYNRKRKEYFYPISKSIRKYNWNNVKKEILCTVSEEFVDDAERHFIKKYNSLIENGMGYNLDSGGNKNKKHSKITKKRIGKNRKYKKGKNHHMWGKHHSIETIEKIKIGNIGKKQSAKSIKKMIKKRYNLKIGWKSINVYNANNKKFIKMFESVTQASKKLNVRQSDISNVLTGKQKTAMGYIFKYT